MKVEGLLRYQDPRITFNGVDDDANVKEIKGNPSSNDDSSDEESVQTFLDPSWNMAGLLPSSDDEADKKTEE